MDTSPSQPIRLEASIRRALTDLEAYCRQHDLQVVAAISVMPNPDRPPQLYAVGTMCHASCAHDAMVLCDTLRAEAASAVRSSDVTVMTRDDGAAAN